MVWYRPAEKIIKLVYQWLTFRKYCFMYHQAYLVPNLLVASLSAILTLF